ncbi:MAG: Mov34/MPN/PAD-1 family protein [Nitrospinaceae bacterium]
MVSAMQAHAVEEYPHECCGIVVGPAQGAAEDRLFKCTNIQDRLHEEDPVLHPRDARTAFRIDDKELFRIHREAQDQGLVFKLFYHSHPDHGAYFSEEDKAMALFGGEPSYPEARYLVISVYNGAVKNQALFEWNADQAAFDRVNLDLS